MATNSERDSKQRVAPRGRVAARALTEAGIRALKAGQSRTDGSLPVGNGRLVVTCTKVRGRMRRTWTFRVRKADQSAEVALGDHPVLTLEEARQRAARLIQLVREGSHIREVIMDRPARAAARANPATGASLRALLTSYVESLHLAGKRSADDVDALFSRHVFEPWPELAATAAARIDATQIRDILARMVHMGIERQTNILRSYLQAAYTHGAHADLDPRRPSQDAIRFKLTGNPVSFVPKVTEFERVRDRVLNDDELRRVWHGLDGLRTEVALTFRCAILLGGQRFRQLLRATWSDFDPSRRVLSLEDSKGRRKAPVPHLLPITDRVATMFDQLRELNGRGSFIFSASAGRTPIHTATLSIAFAGLRGKAERDVGDAVTPIQGRDLRRSIETRLQALGVERDVRAQLLSHGRTSGVQQRHYERHHFLAEKAAALALLEDHIFRVVAPPKSKRARVGRPAGRVATAKKSAAKR